MNIFYINFISLFLYWIVSKMFKNEKYKNLIFFLYILQLIFMVGLRSDGIGIDTDRYSRHFYSVSQISNIKNLLSYSNEIGYVFVQKIFSTIINNFDYFKLFIGIITFTSYYKFITKYSKSSFLSIFLFITLGFYEFQFSGIRQSIALAIGLWTFHYSIEQDFKKFLITLLIATSIHLSAIILLPIYFLYKFRYTLYNAIFYILSVLILIVFRYRIGDYATKIYYKFKRGIDYTSSYGISEGIGGLAIFMLLILIFIFIFDKSKINKSSNNIPILFNILSIGFIVQIFSSFSYLFTRLNFYYMIFIIILIPNIIFNEKSKYRYNTVAFWARTILFVSIIVVFTLQYKGFIDNAAPRIRLIPYETFF